MGAQRLHDGDGFGDGGDGKPGVLPFRPARLGIAFLVQSGFEGLSADFVVRLPRPGIQRCSAASALECPAFLSSHPGEVGDDDERCCREVAAEVFHVVEVDRVDPLRFAAYGSRDLQGQHRFLTG